MMRNAIGMVLALAMLLTGGTVLAGDHERARMLLEKGEIMSLSEILNQTSTTIPGKILEVELEEKGDLVVYEVEFLSEQGVVMEMLIDARDGRIISVEED